MNYKIESQKTKKEILGIIQANTSDRRRPLVAGYGKFFYGKVLDDSFQIQRRVDFRNEFLAVIIGKISESENGSTIDITLRLGSLLKGFLIFWFAVVSSMCVVFPVIMIGYGFTPFFLIPYEMLIFGILCKRQFSVTASASNHRSPIEGDRNEISIKLMEGAKLEYTGQSFTKVFRSPEGIGSSQNVQIELLKNAAFIYSPMPVVPFTDSVYKGETCIKLSESSKLFYSDIFCSGRKERGESFNFKSYVSRCCICIEEKLVFLDNARFVPNECALDSTGFFEGFSHTALIYLYGFELPDYSKLLSDQLLCAHSQCQKGVVLRAFANGAEPLRLFISSLSALCRK